ncbi:hypothetical protein RCL_jg16285.t1 [Rhizophagus clarus]|uniref:Uncharacterized protein n=1 Tax=Rhizophagus clarus TaxID=94130 RepID=A0A8H3M588_9GLOM|nr:hypothetical protein RCL_jg16285.t1 [Rhizophagus clarus]
MSYDREVKFDWLMPELKKSITYHKSTLNASNTKMVGIFKGQRPIISHPKSMKRFFKLNKYTDDEDEQRSTYKPNRPGRNFTVRMPRSSIVNSKRLSFNDIKFRGWLGDDRYYLN